MRQVKGTPAAVFKFGINGGTGCAAAFGKYGAESVIKIFFRIGSMTKREFPVIVKIDVLSLSN